MSHPTQASSVSEEMAVPAPHGEEEAARPVSPVAPVVEARWLRLAPLIVLGVGVLFFLAPIGKSGIWDPFELNVADLSRRIAINVFKAQLTLEGADNTMPKLGDLGRGELPFDSIAIGFRLFGLREWSGRLPLALFGLSGVASLYWLLSRLVDKRAGLYAAVVLSTMPLYYMHARTMLGDIVTMASISMAFAGLGIATFDRPGHPVWRKVAWAVGLLGIVTGFMSRGLLVGVAIPTLGVGLAWAVIIGSSQRKIEVFGEITGAITLALGVAATWFGLGALSRATASEYSVWLGAQVASQSKFPTFDLVVHYLGHSLLPWSAFVPFAVGRLFRTPPATAHLDTDAGIRATALRLIAIVGSAVGFGVYSAMAPKVGYLAYGAPCLLAAIAAVSIRDFELDADASRALGAGVAILMALFLRDYVMFPEKGLSAFAVNAATFPDSFKDRASSLILKMSALFVVVVFFAWLEKKNRPWFDREDYLTWPRALLRAWNGGLAYALAALEVLLIVVAIALFVGHSLLHSKAIGQMGALSRTVLMNGYWALPLLLFLPVWAIMTVRDLFRLFFHYTGISRGMATVGAGLLAGGVLSFVYYPALAAQLSPKEVFESYQRLHAPGEQLGLLGVGGKSVSYYSGGDVKLHSDVQAAFNWLTSTPDRRWLAVRNEDLGRLNSLYRARPQAKQNLPVLDGRSSQIMLVSNVLLPNERTENPYETIVLDHEPPIGNRVEANLQDQLLSLGWDVTDGSGNRVESVVPARKYHFRLYYKVLAATPGEWETFIHIDGFHRRFNGDHKTLGGKYPFNLWQIGDYIVDDYEFSLEPNFTSGSYNVFYGLFVGETRLKVKAGKHDDNRIEAGFLRVQ
ncbi:MAG TPA: glycosyltransferase family 39 protein [Polyangiaceae bacterium]|nr:glycosyltransferase family 39 protein [Polyangiaceae bacterium]